MSDTSAVFRIPKATGSHAETLAAAGLADLLSEIGDDRPLIRDRGSWFEVVSSLSWPEIRATHVPQSPGYPFLKANDKTTVHPRVRDMVDYGTEKAKADRLKKAAAAEKARGKRAVPAIDAVAGEEDKLRPDWRLLQVLNTLQGDEIANKLHVRVITSEPGLFQSQVISALESLSSGEPTRLDWEKSSVQIFTPVAAKGYARLKPDSTDKGDKTKEHWADPFIDWLKCRGYFRIACPFFQGSKGEHVRMLVPAPGSILGLVLTQVSTDLRSAPVYGGAPKVDILAVLYIAEILIVRSEEYHAAERTPFPGLTLNGKTLDDVISALTVTHYQSLGNARAVSSMSTLALPGWFRISEHHDATEMLEALREHAAVIRGLQDDHSDEIGLLLQYRRFLEKRGEAAAVAFLEFLEQYGIFWMKAFGIRQGGRERYPRRFTHRLTRRVVLGNMERLVEILENPGFEAIATAIRKSTVSAQAQKVMGKKDYREIRYDLLHQLRQKRTLSREEFVETVADFVSRYNAENARIREIKKDMKAAPANIKDSEFIEFVALLDKGWKPALVGAMLAAFGSCTEKREGDLQGEPAEAGNEQASE